VSNIIDQIVAKIEEYGAKSVALQFPDSMLAQSVDITIDI
jgi:diphthamide biosynthesis enzyme Dph1/Dph2-like protein